MDFQPLCHPLHIDTCTHFFLGGVGTLPTRRRESASQSCIVGRALWGYRTVVRFSEAWTPKNPDPDERRTELYRGGGVVRG
jgi:hypothetical protein